MTREDRPAVPRTPWGRFAAEATTVAYVAAIAWIAKTSGLTYVMFPELAALSHDIFTRPRGTWARAPGMLVLTPLLTALAGIGVTKLLPYGVWSILLTVGLSLGIIRLLHSPVAPAISAGLLPVTLGVSSWRYPPSLLVGLLLLAGLAQLRARATARKDSGVAPDADDRRADLIEETPRDYSWLLPYAMFIAGMAALAVNSGWRFLLFPPLAVIGFEMFAHAAICPWAKRPLRLPLACTLSAAVGALAVHALGAGAPAAAIACVFGVLILNVLDLHAPPALAVGLLPFVMPTVDVRFPAAVGLGTAALTGSFIAWRRFGRH